MLSPLAPHVGEELWQRLGHAETLAFEPFPVADAALLVDDTVEYPVQVNGKLRSHVTVPADADAAAVEQAALADARVQAAIDGAPPRTVIVVPGPHGQRRRVMTQLGRTQGCRTRSGRPVDEPGGAAGTAAERRARCRRRLMSPWAPLRHPCSPPCSPPSSGRNVGTFFQAVAPPG